MKKIIYCLISTLSLSLGIPKAYAEWYEVTGTAAIVSTESAARLHALENAIYKAVSFAGADIGSISNLMPLLESQRTEYQFSNHEVRYIWVENVTSNSNNMLVKARIDIKYHIQCG